jgi:hypothetical protein
MYDKFTIGGHMKKKTIVYWTMYTAIDRITKSNLLFEPPQHIWSTLPKDGTDSYRACQASHGFFKNTYVLNNALDLSVVLSDDGKTVVPNDGFVLPKHPAYDGQHTITIDYAWLFFTEDDIELAMYPPYLHNPTTAKHGAVHAASYNISKWFRPIVPQYTLWKGVNTFEAKANEPLMYLDFKTDNKIQLQHFELTPEIYEIAAGSVSFKDLKHRVPMQDLYHRFTRSKRDKRLLQLIKQNLL